MEPSDDQSFNHFLEQLGAKIRQIRKEKGLSQMELHYRSDVARDWISDLENGRKNVSIHILYKIATALDMTFHDLVSLPDEADE